VHQRECQNCIQIESFDAADISATLAAAWIRAARGPAARLHAPFAGIQKPEAFSKKPLCSQQAQRILSPPSEGYLRLGGTIPLLEKDKAVPLEFIHSPVHLLGKH
jgi:hypothetical protein